LPRMSGKEATMILLPESTRVWRAQRYTMEGFFDGLRISGRERPVDPRDRSSKDTWKDIGERGSLLSG